MTSEQTIVIIMAGGLGKRMKSDLPKVLHKIDNEPMLVHVIKQSKLLLPNKIMVVVGKYRRVIEETLMNYIDMENICFVDQSEPLGTGHAVQCCIPELKSDNMNTRVLILSGDVPLLQSNTMLKILTNLNKVKIAVTEFDDPYGYGRIVEQNNIFDKMVEEKDCNFEQKQIKKVNCGIYAFNSEILCKYLPLLQPNNSQGEYYLTDIVEIIKIHEKINIEMFEFSKEIQIEIIGVNTVEQLKLLESRIISTRK